MQKNLLPCSRRDERTDNMSFKISYDFARLVAACPRLQQHIVPASQSKGGRDTINFADVRTLLLHRHRVREKPCERL